MFKIDFSKITLQNNYVHYTFKNKVSCSILSLLNNDKIQFKNFLKYGF